MAANESRRPLSRNPEAAECPLPAVRGRGVGKAMLARLAQIAIAEGCSRLEWDVLHWNEPAINFYHRMGAVAQKSWHTMRVAGEPLHRLAAHAPQTEEA